ncbi:MAG: DUF1501 domain-containing protein [Solirubrobacteraceae bacterium]|nr:DUF1501 domain-containing protein [Solirubrobacteraceae bacterium]
MSMHCQDYARSHALAGAGLPMIEPGMPDPAGTGLTRRSVMLRSLGLGMAVYGASALGGVDQVEAAINDALGEHKVLVSVFVDGGWDALSVLAPFGNDHRHEARLAELRPGLAASVARDGANVFAADPSLSWHPAAAGLRDLWNDPVLGVAVAPAIGYSSPNYSHFTSRHFWEVGALEVSGTTGWMGRYLDRVGRADVPIQGVTMGGSLSPSLATSNVPVAAVYDIDAYRYDYRGASGRVAAAATAELRALAAKASGDTQRDQARLVTGASFRLVDDMSAAATTAPTSVTSYPADSSHFIDSLKDTARLLGTRVSGAALPIRCVALRAHGGYDTHSAQEPAFSTNLRITTQGIKAFWADLTARGQQDRVAMLVWSEFGRRPAENGSAGCDHGAAGSAFVIGPSVRQGLIGEFPGLVTHGAAGAGLMRDGNLRATSDFRGLYAALLEQWLGTDADGIVPGAGNRPGAGAFIRPRLF